MNVHAHANMRLKMLRANTALEGIKEIHKNAKQGRYIGIGAMTAITILELQNAKCTDAKLINIGLGVGSILSFVYLKSPIETMINEIINNTENTDDQNVKIQTDILNTKLAIVYNF